MGRRWSRMAVLLTLVLCGGCGSPATTGVASPTPSAMAIQHGKLTVDGHVHTYRLFRPQSLDVHSPAPLVFLLHGCSSNGDEFASLTHFDDQATKRNFVAVYPDGLADFGQGLDHCWNEFLDPSKADDFGFLTQLMDRLTRDPNLDKNRIFVAGIQSGGHMAYTLACAIPDRVVGIASVSGGMPLDGRKASMKCPESGARLSKPVSVMEMHGTADSLIPYGGGGDLKTPPTEDLIKYWALLDRCSGEPSVNKDGITETTLWKHCAGTAEVRLDTVVGGDNEWFGAGAGAVAGEPDASAVVANWFLSGAP